MKSQVDKSAFKYLPALLMIPSHFRLPFSQQFPGSVISQRAVPFFFLSVPSVPCTYRSVLFWKLVSLHTIL